MPDNNTLARPITVDMIHNALNLATYHQPNVIEDPEPVCEWPRLCHVAFCRFPRYYRDGEPTGLTAHVLLELGLPAQLLRELDCEYEMGEVLHPGVKIAHSRNAALKRIDKPGVALLAFLQDNQKAGLSWSQIAVLAFRPRRVPKPMDRKRRPWLY